MYSCKKKKFFLPDRVTPLSAMMSSLKIKELVKENGTEETYTREHSIIMPNCTDGQENGGKTVKQVLGQTMSGSTGYRSPPYSHLKKLLSSKAVLSLSASRSTCSTTTSFGRAAPTSTNQRLWNLLFRGIGIAVEDLYELCELSKSEEQCTQALKVMHSYIGEFEDLLGRIQETNRPGMEESVNDEDQKTEALVSHSGMQHIFLDVSAPQSLGQLSLESSKDENMVIISDCYDGMKEYDDFRNEGEGEMLTEDVAHSVMEAIWTEAEALVEAEARAEDDAWAKLTTTTTIEVSTDKNDNPTLCKEGDGTPTEKYWFGLSSEDGIHFNEESFASSTVENDSQNRIDVVYPSHSPTATEDGGGILDDPLKARLLQQKLSSLIRRKPSPTEAKRRHDARQAAAELNRMQLAHGVAVKQKQRNERAQELRQRQDWAREQTVMDISKRLDSAGARRAAHMQQIVAKANDENIKVDEVTFINRLTVEGLQASLHQRLAEVEARIQEGRERRNQHLIAKQHHRAHAKVTQMSAQQLEKQNMAAQRWQTLEKRLEDVHKRREERMSAALQCQERCKNMNIAHNVPATCDNETTSLVVAKSSASVNQKQRYRSQKRQRKRKGRNRSKHHIINGSNIRRNLPEVSKLESEEEALRNTITESNAVVAASALDTHENHHLLNNPSICKNAEAINTPLTSSPIPHLSRSKLPSKVKSKRAKRSILQLQVLHQPTNQLYLQ